MRDRDLIFGFESFDGFYIAHEVLFDRTYDIRFPKPTVVLDIGANFGLASLFFAGLPQVEHVYSWEPIRETYLSLRANISRNASLAHKITPFQCGLSSSARRENWLYNPRFAGMTGAETPVPGSSVGELWRRFPAQSVGVDLEQASQAIASCCAAHPTADVFCKVDCEGGEYEIIGDLAAAGTLERIQGCVVEVHGGRGGNAETLKRSLSDFGFLLLGDCDKPVQAGRAAVLWAIRRAR